MKAGFIHLFISILAFCIVYFYFDTGTIVRRGEVYKADENEQAYYVQLFLPYLFVAIMIIASLIEIGVALKSKTKGHEDQKGDKVPKDRQ